MMSVFSEESLLLIKNWDTVEDILKAHERLGEELASLLLSIESELARYDWWSRDGWTFVPYQRLQVYISNQKWRLPSGNFAVWIGVEGFTSSAIFGMGSPPTLYVWVGGKQYDLARILAERIEESEGEVLGDIDRRESGYAVKHAVRKCLPEEAEGFDEVVRSQISDFFVHYAKVLWRLDAVIEAYLAKLGEDADTDSE
jgi:hypothetical protein